MDLKQIETALAAEVIYNVDFVELKSQLNRLIDKADRAAHDAYLAAARGNRERDVLMDAYYGSPMAHTLKSFAKKLPATAPAELMPALTLWRQMVVDFTPAAEALQAAKGRVLKARKPSATPRKTPERTIENTGTCPCCGQNVKLNAGRLVAHGYTIRWGFQSGNCFAVGLRPIEVSPEGLTAAIAAYERQLGVARLELEYGNRRQRAHADGNIRGIEGALKAYRRALADWAPRALPDGNTDHMK